VTAVCTGIAKSIAWDGEVISQSLNPAPLNSPTPKA